MNQKYQIKFKTNYELKLIGNSNITFRYALFFAQHLQLHLSLASKLCVHCYKNAFINNNILSVVIITIMSSPVYICYYINFNY